MRLLMPDMQMNLPKTMLSTTPHVLHKQKNVENGKLWDEKAKETLIINL